MTGQQHLSWAQKEAKRDKMNFSERSGEIAAVIGIVLVSLFFYAHQAWSTGFFTAAFGPTEAFFLYGSLVSGITGPLARLVIGRRNISRLPELAASVFWIVGSIQLFLVFPFDFAHFGDVLPDFAKFVVAWVSNDLARVLFALGIAGGIAFTATTAILYLKVRKHLRARYAHQAGNGR